MTFDLGRQFRQKAISEMADRTRGDQGRSNGAID